MQSHREGLYAWDAAEEGAADDGDGDGAAAAAGGGGQAAPAGAGASQAPPQPVPQQAQAQAQQLEGDVREHSAVPTAARPGGVVPAWIELSPPFEGVASSHLRAATVGAPASAGEDAAAGNVEGAAAALRAAPQLRMVAYMHYEQLLPAVLQHGLVLPQVRPCGLQAYALWPRLRHTQSR